MTKQVAINKAEFPVYIEAKKAVAECARIDECAALATKMAAYAAYARQANDTELLENALRISCRAHERAGELLKEFRNTKSPGRPKKGGAIVPPLFNGGHQPPPLSAKAAAQAAGLSRDKAKQMLRIANVPKPLFERLVDGPDPPTPKKLAKIGTKKQERPRPKPYRNEWIDWTVAVGHLSSLPACGLEVLAVRCPFEIDRLKCEANSAVVNLKLWCVKIGAA
jgi:hypothetical protein